MKFHLQFEVPTDKLINIVELSTGLKLVLNKDQFEVKPIRCSNGSVSGYIAKSVWDVSQVKKMWQVESRLKRANIIFNVKTVRN